MKKMQSFNDRLKAGVNKEELIKYYCMTEAQYEKTIACLDRIHAAAQGVV